MPTPSDAALMIVTDECVGLASIPDCANARIACAKAIEMFDAAKLPSEDKQREAVARALAVCKQGGMLDVPAPDRGTCPGPCQADVEIGDSQVLGGNLRAARDAYARAAAAAPDCDACAQKLVSADAEVERRVRRYEASARRHLEQGRFAEATAMIEAGQEHGPMRLPFAPTRDSIGDFPPHPTPSYPRSVVPVRE